MPLDPIAQTSCPIPLRLTAIRGDSISIKLRLVNVATGRPIVLTDWSGEAKIWNSVNADVALHELDVDVDQAAAGQSTTGIVTISADPGATILWKLDGFWSLALLAEGIRKTIISGPWQMFGPGLAGPAYICGVCLVPEIERVGTACVVARDGYQEIRLPYPQAACTC